MVVGDVLMLFLLFSGLCQNQIRIGCTPDSFKDDNVAENNAEIDRQKLLQKFLENPQNLASTP